MTCAEPGCDRVLSKQNRSGYCKDHGLARDRAKYWADPEKARQRARDFAAANPEKGRAYKLCMNYGLCPEDVDDILARQDGCAICHTWEPGPRGWHVDHDHTCCVVAPTCGGCVRGILCAAHNIMLGHANDDPAILRAAADYLDGGVTNP